MIAELNSIGLNFPRWQDALEAAYASGRLGVLGEVGDGQLLCYDDASGSRLVILAAEPYGCFASFRTGAPTTGHISMVTDIIGVVDIVADTTELHTSGQSAPVLGTVTATVDQGPLFSDAGTLNYQPIALSAIATDVRLNADGAGSQEPSVVSTGYRDLSAGSTAPHAGAQIRVPLASVRPGRNELTGQSFTIAEVQQPFPFTLLLADDIADPAELGATVVEGAVVEGTVQFAVSLSAPATCGGAGGCGSGSCGCDGCS
ncbi:hypothetical protein [Corynebacterium heidelbergense]|uniref:Uncharacterized protein n=1 Tax=Corynebacterium heidelbergense TaxID=2055947 RepID=A0A364V4H0_9CORY|nr:hypothetical protein [Corynebacterium heidelbergense]RAV31550.1 hypothetical protein DLJ54_07780 [Corynebacterium heidelbergense]